MVGLGYGTFRLIYNWQFNALRRELQRNDFTIVGQWRHEDLTLEDFGFTVRTSAGEFGIDILDASNVRTPRDPIDGLAIIYPGEKGGASFLLESNYWKNLQLPEVTTVADALKHMPRILEAVRTMPPAKADTASVWYDPALNRHLFLRIPKPPSKELPRT